VHSNTTTDVKTPNSGLLIVLSGPSGVGKGSIVEKALQRLPQLCRSISVTTRPKRPAEIDGKDYFFRTSEQFEQMKQQGELLEWAQYLDYYYGTPLDWVKQNLAAGNDIVLEIDVQGGLQIKDKFPQAILIFVEPPSDEALRERLKGRNTETEESLDRRVRAYRKEREYLPYYNYTIKNELLDVAVDKFCDIVTREHAKLSME